MAASFGNGAPGLFNDDCFARVQRGDYCIVDVVTVQLLNKRHGFFPLCMGHGCRFLVELNTYSMV